MLEREANSRDLYEKAPLAYFTVSADRMIKDCNNMASQMLGYGKEELIDKDIIGLLGDTPSDRKKGEEIWDKALKGEVIRHAIIRLVRKDGSLAWGSLALNAVNDKDGKIIGCRCMMSDITEHVTLEAQPQQPTKMEAVGALAGGIAYDFNKLSMSIQRNISLLLMHMDSTHPHYTRLKSIEKQARRVVRTADQVIKGTETVLLVDDEEAVLEVGKELLEVIGYRVLTATSGKEAIEVYENSWDDIDIVLLDLVMPNMGGGEAYDRLKRSNPAIKPLLLSGYSMNCEANDVLQRSCDTFIQKPFNAQELSHKRREVLDKE